MIIKEFKLQDEAFQKYKSYNGKDVEATLATQLIRFQDVKPTSRIIVVPERQRQEMEVLLDRFVDSADDLLQQIKRCMSLKVEGIQISLSPDQLERLKHQAEFEGKEFKVYLEEKMHEAVKMCLDGYL